ncbi:MAG: NAD(P)-dependent oxidoreductase [Planctomycetales bacterium]|nr:NAD(P)-dependent oxidoreductase [Planctomycetales bacterium]
MILAVTGATGFLGRAFVERACAAGHEVRALVRTSSRIPAGWRAPQVRAVPGDLADDGAALRLLEGAETWVHLAAAGVAGPARDWDEALRTNVGPVVPWLRRAVSAKVRLAVAAGTGLEYAGRGRLPDAPWPDGRPAEPLLEDSPLETADPYAASKAAGGLLLRAGARESGFPLRYLRLAPLYGPGDTAGKLLPSAVLAARARRPFEMSPGEQVRDWLHVSDAAAALLAATERTPRAGVEVVNVGTGRGVSHRTLVGGVFARAGADPGLVRAGARPYRPGEPHHLVLDRRAAERLLGWVPRIGLEEGLDALVAAPGDPAERG